MFTITRVSLDLSWRQDVCCVLSMVAAGHQVVIDLALNVIAPAPAKV
jgi:hypothetical protein